MPNSLDDIVSDVIEREGGSAVTNRPNDPGGRTQYGISERSNPKAWLDGKVTEQEAKEIYLSKYVVWPKFHQIPATHTQLQAQLIDYGVHSGPQLAIQKLQMILNVEVDGVIGPRTLLAIRGCDPRILNNRLVVERVKMIGRVVQKNPGQLSDLSGFLNRALSFIL